jgi:protein gp37
MSGNAACNGQHNGQHLRTMFSIVSSSATWQVLCVSIIPNKCLARVDKIREYLQAFSFFTLTPTLGSVDV